MICNLPRSVLNTLKRMWILDHSLDCFAPYYNAKTPRFFSRFCNPATAGVDAFLRFNVYVTWYISPWPFSLMQLFQWVRPEALPDVTRSLWVLSARINMLIYSKNKYLILFFPVMRRGNCVVVPPASIITSVLSYIKLQSVVILNMARIFA